MYEMLVGWRPEKPSIFLSWMSLPSGSSVHDASLDLANSAKFGNKLLQHLVTVEAMRYWDWCRKSNKFNSIALVRQCPMQSLPCDCVVVKASCETSQVTGRSVLGGCWPTNWVGPSRKGGSSWTACTLRRESMLRFLGEVLLLLSCLKRASVDLQSA